MRLHRPAMDERPRGRVSSGLIERAATSSKSPRAVTDWYAAVRTADDGARPLKTRRFEPGAMNEA